MYSSPFADRFNKISEKLGTIPLSAENSRSHRIDNLESKVKGIEDKFNDAISNYNRKVNGLKEDVVRL